MNTKKRIMIDMDDVICSGGFLYLVNQFTHQNYTTEDFTKYYMQDIIKPEKKVEWLEFFKNSNMYDQAKFIGSARETIQKLSEAYEVFIVTAYLMKDDISISGKLLKDKFAWLQENLPFIHPQNYVFTNNKDVVNCDIKIDDRPSNLTGTNVTKLLFTAYHNKNLTNEELNAENIQRVDSWEEIEKILL